MKVIFLNSFAQLILFGNICGQGIAFDTSFQSWNQVVEKAKQLNKPIFVDVYTSWCGPCKFMDKNVFNLKEVGDYYNNFFLNIKLDAEKGYGPDFSKQFLIEGYPTYLFFTPGGEAVSTALGSSDAEQFLNKGKYAIKEYKAGQRVGISRSDLPELKKEIEEGKAGPDYIAGYLKKASLLKIPDTGIFESYLSKLPKDSLYSQSTLTFVQNYYQGWLASNSLGLQVLLTGFKKYPIRDFELMKPWINIIKRLETNVEIAASRKDSLGIEDIIRSYRQLDSEDDNFEMDKEYVYSRYYARVIDTFQFMKHLNRYVQENVFDETDGNNRQEQLERYRKVLKFKFGVDDSNLIPPGNQWFKNSYNCIYKRTVELLFALSTEYFESIGKDEETENIFSVPLEAALENYKQFSPNFNEMLFDIYKKRLSSW